MVVLETALILDLVAQAPSYFWGKMVALLLAPGAPLSIASLVTALTIAIFAMSRGWRKSRRKIPLRVLVRAIFPRNMLRSASSRADVGFVVFHTFIHGAVLGWAVYSAHAITSGIHGQLVAIFGAASASAMPEGLAIAIATAAAFLAFEFGFWLDHYLCHRVPFLWEFHKVHHAAEVLTPLTNFRVHPVDTIVFGNILAVTVGVTQAFVTYGLGRSVEPLTLFNANVIILATTYLIDHLYHSQFWIAFTGVLGRIIFSPAHHQIHHSTNPVHFNKNLGRTLAIWDWMFGTLHVPSKKRERLTFGVEPCSADPHTIKGSLVMPFHDAFAPIAADVRTLIAGPVEAARTPSAPSTMPTVAGPHGGAPAKG